MNYGISWSHRPGKCPVTQVGEISSHTGWINIQSHRPGKYPDNIITDPGSGILHMNYLLIDHLYQYQKLSSNKDKQKQNQGCN